LISPGQRSCLVSLNCISIWSAWPHRRRRGRCSVADAGTSTGPVPAGPAIFI